MAKKTLSRAGAASAPTAASSARKPKAATAPAGRPGLHPRARAAVRAPGAPAASASQVARAAATSSERAARPRQGDTAPVPERRPAPTPPAKPTRHKVRARKMGFVYHERRRVGDVFMVHGKDFNPSWMEVVDGSTPLRKTTGKQELRRLHDEILSQKRAERLTTDEHPEIPTGTANPLGAEE
jgi:hypothetical protein